jgi:L-Ala-D/L-Glu epimerase
MKVTAVSTIPVSVPYTHREVSSVVSRDGVTDVLVKVETNDGRIGWGESCSGADVRSVEAAVQAMVPFVIGRDPWNHDAIQAELSVRGLWQHRAGTGNFAYAGLDMALLDLCGQDAGVPIFRLLGGLRRTSVDYFYYLSRGSADDIAEQCAAGLRAGYQVFYLKVGLDHDEDHAAVAAARGALGDGVKLRLDANGSWNSAEALQMLARLQEYDLDFVEQPVRDHPIGHMSELRKRLVVPVAANEGLWSEADVYARILARQADVFCFSPYWVGSIRTFHRLAQVAHLEGLAVCKHTHGELGIAAAAAHHALLALPNIVDGNQQTAQMIQHDIVSAPLPIAEGPTWGLIEGDGLGVEVDTDAVAEANARYEANGQYQPWQAEELDLLC